MKGKIIMNLAMSLDGYIADEEGHFDWIQGRGEPSLNTPKQYQHEQFLNDIDIVVMGKNSYVQGLAEEYKNKQVYVATSIKIQDKDNIHFIQNNIVDVILKEKEKGKNIYLFGGGILVDYFIKEDIIDEYIVGIIPVILGQGRPLFFDENPTIPLYLSHYSITEGICILHYIKKSI